ncbi:MAG: NADH-quinone oxidoreductase subunit M [Deltaproteobacteria bacterium]|jgi:NADH-quinone oxidoreductase subunit M
MILTWLIVILLIGGLLALPAGRLGRKWPAVISLAAISADLALVLFLWAGHFIGPTSGSRWLIQYQAKWIPQLGIGFHLGVDGLSLILIILTGFLGLMAVASTWTEIKERTGFFHFNLLWCLAGVVGVFTALDLFLFYLFWELMLVPMYFIISIWGHENRYYASVKFFLFTQMSGLLMLAAILGLYFVHGQNTGHYTFDYTALLGTHFAGAMGRWLFAGFLAAFLVKLPSFFFHTWLPDAHTEAPTAGSIILAGLLLKTGAYGLLRFAVPLFPAAAHTFSTGLMAVGVLGILYGAVLAFAQTDLKRLVAYTSVSHMGFVLLGVFAWNELALQGVVVQIVCHGVSTGALFFLVGALQERLHTRDLDRMGGLWTGIPRFGGTMLFFGLASLGLPGLGNFIGEFLVLYGTYRVSVIMTAFAALGFVVATIYALWMVQRALFGQKRSDEKIIDLSLREIAASAAMVAVIVWLGFYPWPLLHTARQGLTHIRENVQMSQPAGSPATLPPNEVPKL